MNYREQFYEGEIDGKTLLDVIDEKESEAQALREQNTKFQHMLTDVVAKHFAENIKRSTAQKSMDVYLSEGIRLLEEEVADARRDAEQHEIRANQYSEELAALRARAVVVPERMTIPVESSGFVNGKLYGWNHCLDAVERLNGKAVSEVRILEIADKVESLETASGYACGLAQELRSLLNESAEVGDVLVRE